MGCLHQSKLTGVFNQQDTVTAGAKWWEQRQFD